MAKPRFNSFVVFAEMRTGSNFLESNLNAIDGVTCHGEAFNPYFLGGDGKTELLGVTMESRNANPAQLLRVMRERLRGSADFAISTITTRACSIWWWMIRASPRSS